jgi:TP901-1 family phage major tail protein
MRNGKETIVLVQPVDAALGSQALVLAHQTESSHSYERELVDEQTKFGRVLSYGNLSETIELTCYGETNDPGQSAALNAIKQGKQLKIWEVDVNLNENSKHAALFAYTLVESAEKSFPGDNFEEVTVTLQVVAESVDGELDPLPLEILEFGKYGFEAPGDTTGEFGGEQQEAVPVTGVTATPAALDMVVGDTEQLTIVVAPENASNQNVTITSSNPTIAKVSPTGLVTAVASGTATITVTTVSGEKTATVTVDVTTV